MLKVCLIKTSVNSMAEAEKMAASLVKAQRAACVQITGPGRSVYRWQGKLEIEQEYYLTIKTAPSLREATVLHLARSHPYETPEILWSECDAGNAYGQWLHAEVDNSGSRGVDG